MPSYQVKQSSTAYPLVFLMVDSADHITGKTGLSPTVTLSKAGGSFAAPAGAVSEVGSGWYKVAGNATDSGTLGPLALHATGAGADPTDALYEVVAHDVQDATRLGLSALPNAAANANGGLPVLSSSGTTLAYTVSTLTTYTGNTPQTGDAYAVVNDAAFGNAKLVRSTTPANTLDVSATGEAGLDFNNVKDATAGHTLTNITVPTVTTVTNQLTAAAIATGVWQDATAGDFTVASSIGKSLYTAGAVPGAAGGLFIAGSNAATTVNFTGSLSGSVGSVAGNVGGNVAGSVASVTAAVVLPSIPANWITAAGVADGAIDNATFAADTGLQTVRSGTCQAGSTSTTAKLDAGASATDNSYRNCGLYLTGGTGAGQFRFVRSYAGSTKVATVNRAWATTPDATTTFAVLPRESAWEEERADHAAAGTFGEGVASVQGSVTGSVDSVNQTVFVAGGTVDVVINAITLPSIPANWITAAGIAADADAELAAAVWDLATSGHTTSGTFGAAMNAAGSAGDPWATSLPGAYGAGTAGSILGNKLGLTVTAGGVTLADGVAHGGTTADLSLRSVSIIKSGVGATVFIQNTGAGSAVSVNSSGAVATFLVANSGAGSGQTISSGTGTGLILSGVTALDVSTGGITGSITGSLSGSVGSVTGNVGGNLVGKVVGSGATPLLATGAVVTLDTSQPLYTPAKAGDAMTLTGGERTTLAGVVWANAARTLTSFGTLAADAAAAVWGATTRTLSAFGFTVAIDQAAAVAQVDVTNDATLTVGKALLAARAQAAGAWAVVGTTLVLKNPDGSTFRTFTLDDATNPTSRT